MNKKILALVTVTSWVVLGCTNLMVQPKRIAPSIDMLGDDVQWSTLYNNIKVGKIRHLDVGGDNDIHTTESGNLSGRVFRKGLEITLARANLLASGEAAQFRLDVHDSDLSLPLVGSTAEPRWRILYELIDTGSGEVLWRALVDTTGTANMADAGLATIRIRIANERALKMNLRKMVEKLAKLEPSKQSCCHASF